MAGMLSLLVLTDAGEEVDDEAALWLLLTHLGRAPNVQADVLFVTGNPVQRAMRWAEIVTSAGAGSCAGASRMRYFLGPETTRHMRYKTKVSVNGLMRAGIRDVQDRSYDGGAYDVILQISPVTGFSDDFSNPPEGIQGALGRISRNARIPVPLYIIVGAEGSTNFPRDSLHRNFKSALAERGFAAVHVEAANYIKWDSSIFRNMPPALVEKVVEDEWKKVIGRILPSAASLFVRFRVNTNVNYDIVHRVYTAFKRRHEADGNFAKAHAWWSGIAESVQRAIESAYIEPSRKSDIDKGDNGFGNPDVTHNISGMNVPWSSIMSTACKDDIGLEGTCSVDRAMGLALTSMTGMLLKIYAFTVFAAGEDPSEAQIQAYLTGTVQEPPLDASNFPHMAGDASEIKEHAVGSPMYDPAGMLVALLALAASREQLAWMVDRLQGSAELLGPGARLEAMHAAYAGEGPLQLAGRFFAPGTGAPSRPSSGPDQAKASGTCLAGLERTLGALAGEAPRRLLDRLFAPEGACSAGLKRMLGAVAGRAPSS